MQTPPLLSPAVALVSTLRSAFAPQLNVMGLTVSAVRLWKGLRDASRTATTRGLACAA